MVPDHHSVRQNKCLFFFALFSVGVITKEVGDESCLLSFPTTGHAMISQFHEILSHRIGMKIALKRTGIPFFFHKYPDNEKSLQLTVCDFNCVIIAICDLKKKKRKKKWYFCFYFSYSLVSPTSLAATQPNVRLQLQLITQQSNHVKSLFSLPALCHPFTLCFNPTRCTV